MERMQKSLEKRRKECIEKHKSPVETSRLTARLIDRVDTAAVFLDGLEERLKCLQDAAAADAAAGHPWPDVTDDTAAAAAAASRDVSVEAVRARQHRHKAALLAEARTAVPE
jgi:hypothetical protein